MKEIALYIHIPFCKQKCFYCDFLSFGSEESKIDKYVDALCKEILMYKNYRFKSIFIGGGTPTYLSYKHLNKLKDSMNQINKSKDVEFTVEGNPGTFTEEKLQVLKDMGVNRLSIGLQAWQNELLKRIGRIHEIKDFVDSYNMARKLGFENINVDLMFGLPGQTMEMWKETLEEITKLNPEHISAYGLIIEEGTKFFKMYEEDELDLPDEDLERDMYRYCLELLNKKAYKQYEISNFSKENKECKHNLTYWELGEYVGCGLGAHGYVEKQRIENVSSMMRYIELLKNEIKPIEHRQISSKEDVIEEFMFLGLRKIKGIDKKEFKNKFNIDIESIYGEIIDKYKSQGLIEEEYDRIFLSKKGIEFSNIVMSDFIIER